VIQESKCFGCRDFGHITCNCRNVKRRRKKGLTLILSNKFEVLTSRVMNVGILSGGKVRKKRKLILREEKSVEVKKKIEGGKLLKEVIIKIRLKQKENEEGIIVKVLLDSGAIRLVISLEFARKNNFKKKKLDILQT